MTGLLLRLFVKDHMNTEDGAVRARYGKLSGTVGIICNLLLFAAKLTVGILSGSISVSADAVNNLSDASSSVVTMIGFRLASKPADKKHPYGHSRYEYFAGLAVAAIIIFIGIELAKSSIERIIRPEAVDFSPALVIVLVLSIAVKLWLSLFNGTLGKRINSKALAATAADSRNDVISTLAVLVSCVVGKFTGLMIDGYVGIFVAAFILRSGIGIAGDTINPLLGEAPDEQLVHLLGKKILSHDLVLGIHDLIVHDYGPGRRFASVHVEMDCRIDPMTAHERIDEIEHEIKKDMNIDLVIHYDPIVTDDDEINKVKKKVTDILDGIDSGFSVHDFRMVKGSASSNVIFDLVVPGGFEDKEDEIREKIESGLCTGEMKYRTVITFDTEAFNDRHTR